MSSSHTAMVPLQTADSLNEEIEEMYDQITRRAQEIFEDRGGIGSVDLEDWLAAERGMVLKPDVLITQTGDEIMVAVRLGKVNLTDVHVLVTPLAMLIRAKASPMAKKVFRTIEFPHRVDVQQAEAKLEDGYLVLTA